MSNGRATHIGRRGAWRAIALLAPALALAACARSVGAPASGQTAHGANQPGSHWATITGTVSTPATDVLGTISGVVVAGPTCPVEAIKDTCAPKAVPDRDVSIQTPAGVEVARAVTDANGHFAVRVAAGAYVVRVSAGPGMLGLDQVTPGDVTVRAGQTSEIQIELDTGIR